MIFNCLFKGGKLKCLHHSLDILPHVMCRSPQESLEILSDVRKPPDYTDHDRLFDPIEFKSTTFQRPFQYLKRLDTNCKLNDVNTNVPEGDKKQCLNTLLRCVFLATSSYDIRCVFSYLTDFSYFPLKNVF